MANNHVENQLAYHNLKTLNTKIRDARSKRQLAFLHSLPVFSQLDRLVAAAKVMLVGHPVLISLVFIDLCVSVCRDDKVVL